MPEGSALALAGCHYLGMKYSEMDCQRFVEKCLQDIGLRKDLAGSNAWYRFILRNGWIGSPEACKSVFGAIPKGVFLFIHAFDGGEPERYRQDGIGNASHIGIYTGMTGAEMAALAAAEGNRNAAKFNFGDGAIHSSGSRGAVATSRFAGRTIRGGWNRVGLWNAVSYGDPIDRIIQGRKTGGKAMTAKTYAENGKPVNFRKQPGASGALAGRIPVGESVEVYEKGPDWCFCQWKGQTGYVMTRFLNFGERVPGVDPDPAPAPDRIVAVNREDLEKVYDIIGNLLGVRR